MDTLILRAPSLQTTLCLPHPLAKVSESNFAYVPAGSRPGQPVSTCPQAAYLIDTKAIAAEHFDSNILNPQYYLRQSCNNNLCVNPDHFHFAVPTTWLSHLKILQAAMADIHTLRKSVTEMSDEELMEALQAIRSDRRTGGATATGTAEKKAKQATAKGEADLAKLFEGMSTEQIMALVKQRTSK